MALGITFDGNKPLLEVYTDASWLLSPKPFAGHVIMYCGATISYSARKLKIIPQSTAEAETAAYANAAKDLRFVMNVLHFFEGKYETPVKIMCDNSATVSTIMKPGVTGRTKHYTNWLWFGRKQFLDKVSVPVWVSTNDQTADVMTKALGKDKFIAFRNAMLNI